MPPGGPGANSRGRGGKFKKYTRGGGKHFSRNLRPLDADGNEVSMWSEGAKNKGSDDEEGSEDESSSEEESDDDDAGPSKKQQPSAELTREERRAQKKAAKEAAIARGKGQKKDLDKMAGSESDGKDDEGGALANPNHTRQARSQTKAPVTGVEEATKGVKKLALTRRERESLEAQEAKERYRALHEAGKTDEAKADMARLAVIREKRAAEAAQKAAEKEEKEAEERRKRALIEEKEAKKREFALGGKKSGKKK